ncbi:MAG: hypothetical protein KKA05_01415, partial [Alphaproteobacteria bacterium]|nr:hypothetical protein [Alphaproteobacteria bacterium]
DGMAMYVDAAMKETRCPSYRALSEKLEIANNSVSLWLSGKTLPTDGNMVKLAQLGRKDEALALAHLGMMRTANDENAYSVYKKLADALGRMGKVALILASTLAISTGKADASTAYGASLAKHAHMQNYTLSHL